MRSLPLTTESIRERKWVYVTVGGILALLGLAAMLAPSFSSEAIERVIGWLLLLGGILFGFGTWLSKRQGWPAWLSLIGALAAAVAGGLLLWSPTGGQGTLNAILVAFFAGCGLAKAGLALTQRKSIPTIWPWLLAAGVLDIAMAIAVLNRFPFEAGWLLGLLMGISLLTSGVLMALIAYVKAPAAG